MSLIPRLPKFSSANAPDLKVHPEDQDVPLKAAVDYHPVFPGGIPGRVKYCSTIGRKSEASTRGMNSGIIQAEPGGWGE